MTITLTDKERAAVEEALSYFPAEYWSDELTQVYDKLEECKLASQLRRRLRNEERELVRASYAANTERQRAYFTGKQARS